MRKLVTVPPALSPNRLTVMAPTGNMISAMEIIPTRLNIRFTFLSRYFLKRRYAPKIVSTLVITPVLCPLMTGINIPIPTVHQSNEVIIFFEFRVM